MLAPGPLERAVERSLALRLFDLTAVERVLAENPNRRGAATLAHIVETDGHEDHGTRAAFERDRARDTRFTARGYRVVRFTHRQIVGKRERERVARALIALVTTK